MQRPRAAKVGSPNTAPLFQGGDSVGDIFSAMPEVGRQAEQGCVWGCVEGDRGVNRGKSTSRRAGRVMISPV
ncbi:hypothetical protein RRG08_026055 [Elysia crispata]|uniref:Uncharacterized protein n=1 Tax=Elysia crispata TaxID=231223 RepID=A0AAE0Z0M1_9GAST|nr:hypothetical protein RRG08_026055 [Elysia crispata]